MNFPPQGHLSDCSVIEAVKLAVHDPETNVMHPVDAYLGFTPSDPLSIRLSLFLGDTWSTTMVYRDYLLMLFHSPDEVHGIGGEFAIESAFTSRYLMHFGPEGEAHTHLYGDRAPLAQFLRRTTALIPVGTEELAYDWDTIIEQLITGGGSAHNDPV